MNFVQMLLPAKFDLNEWFILGGLALTHGIMFALPRRFPATVTLLVYVFCLFIGTVTDHNIGLPPFEAYDINDKTLYELFDILSYFLFPPFGYFFVYFYDKWSVRGLTTILYLLVWSFIAVGTEWLTLAANVYMYKGWQLLYSFPTYLFFQSALLLFFKLITAHYEKTKLAANRRN